MNRLKGFTSLIVLSFLAVVMCSCNEDDVTTVYISSKSALISFREDVNNKDDNYQTDGGVNVVLTADIDLEGEEWIPIGNSADTPFSATFNGNGHTISNLTITNGTQYQGLLGYVYDGTIKNLKLENPNVSGNQYVGAICGYIGADSSVSNCSVTGGSVSGKYNVGGLIGEASWTSITKCYNEGTTVTMTHTQGYNIGGVAGHSSSSTLSNTYNTGDVVGAGICTGGVVGQSYYASIVGCYNKGTVTSTGNYVGGVAGSSSTYIITSYNKGDVSGESHVGGIVGYSFSSYSTGSNVTSCYNTGKVSATTYAGGIVGVAYYSATLTTNYFVEDAEDDAIYGAYVCSKSYDEYTPTDDGATPLSSIAELNDKVDAMNNSIINFEFDGSSVNISYCYLEGSSDSYSPTIY